jgi:hypothetical protein
MHYPFERSDDDPNTFLFRTSLKLAYEIRFKHTPYLFENAPEFADDVYELSIILAEGPTDKTPTDPAIAKTVFAIGQAFIEQVGHPIFLFICDTRDGRQAVRARTFSRWFADLNNPHLFKLDGTFPDEQAGLNYITLIIQLEHPYYYEATAAFADLMAAYNRPK